MEEQFKIAIIIRSFNRGGAEVLIREMFDNAVFKKNIKDYDLIILDPNEAELVKDLTNINYCFFNIFSSSFFKFFVENYKLYKFLKEKEYDILHIHLPNAGIILRFLKFFIPRSKLIYTEHNIVNYGNRVSYYLNGLSYFRNDYTTFVSTETKKSVDSHKRFGFYFYKQGGVIENGVNTDKFFCLSKTDQPLRDSLTIGTIVSMRKQKRLDRWIKVAEVFKKNYPDIPVKFIIAGSGEERKMIDKLIAEKSLAAYIDLPGLVINTLPVYNEIDIFLMTSDFEGLPVALLEAMSCACIPIVSNVGGIKDLDFNGFGYKYDEFDPEEISKVIFQYYINKTKIISERRKAREFVLKHNSLDTQVQQYITIYKSVCNKKLSESGEV